MSPRDRELLTGMGNCFEACHASFAETLEMVAGSRDLTTDEVQRRLAEIRSVHGGDDEYRRLRSRLPAEFPF